MANQKQRQEATKFDANAPKNYEDAKSQFEAALEKARNIPANGMKEKRPVNPGYMMRNGVPCKFKNGQWIPLTKMN